MTVPNHHLYNNNHRHHVTTLIHGVKALGRFFQKESSRFSPRNTGTILILEGQEHRSSRSDHHSSSSSGSSGRVETMAGRQLDLILSQKMGFRTMVSKGSSHSPVFPTPASIQEQLEFMTRVGVGTTTSTTICGIGSRATLDLAKAVAVSVATSTTKGDENENDNSNDNNHELILVPDSWEAVLTCTHPYSLLLQDQEDVLVPFPATTKPLQIPNTTVALLEPRTNFVPAALQKQALTTAVYACLAILLDALPQEQQQEQQQRKNPHGANDPNSKVQPQPSVDHISELVEKCQTVLVALEEPPGSTLSDRPANESSDYHNHKAVMDILMETGSTYLQFGLEAERRGRRRSIPLAIMVSLLPTIFPDQDTLTILASMLASPTSPLYNNSSSNNNNSNSNTKHNDIVQAATAAIQNHPTLLPPPLLTTLEPVEQLMNLIQTNQMHWNSMDASPKELRSLVELFSVLPP